MRFEHVSNQTVVHGAHCKFDRINDCTSVYSGSIYVLRSEGEHTGEKLNSLSTTRSRRFHSLNSVILKSTQSVIIEKDEEILISTRDCFGGRQSVHVTLINSVTFSDKWSRHLDSVTLVDESTEQSYETVPGICRCLRENSFDFRRNSPLTWLERKQRQEARAFNTFASL